MSRAAAAAVVRADSPLVVVTGSDDVLVAEAVLETTRILVGDDDAAMLVEEMGASRLVDEDGNPDLTPLVDSAQTLPFLTDRRILVCRGLGRFTKADDLAPLIEYLADPLPETVLVLVWEKAPDQQGRAPMPKALKEALAAAGATNVDTDPGRKVAAWVTEELGASDLVLDRQAVNLVVDHVGEVLLEVLHGLGPERVEPAGDLRSLLIRVPKLLVRQADPAQNGQDEFQVSIAGPLNGPLVRIGANASAVRGKGGTHLEHDRGVAGGHGVVHLFGGHPRHGQPDVVVRQGRAILGEEDSRRASHENPHERTSNDHPDLRSMLLKPEPENTAPHIRPKAAVHQPPRADPPRYRRCAG